MLNVIFHNNGAIVKVFGEWLVVTTFYRSEVCFNLLNAETFDRVDHGGSGLAAKTYDCSDQFH